MVKTVSPIVEPVAPIELPSNTVPSARIRYAVCTYRLLIWVRPQLQIVGLKLIYKVRSILI